MTGCGKGSTGPGGATFATSYQGVMMSALEWGTVALNVAPSGGVNPLLVSGTIRLATANSGGSPYSVTGTFDSVTYTLKLRLKGYPSDQFSAVVAGGEASGSFNGGGGIVNLDWVAVFAATGTPVLTYCGFYAGSLSGPWSIAVKGSQLNGAYGTGGSGPGAALTGTLSGSGVSLSFGSGGTATGVLQDTTMHGTWSSSGNNSGTWFSRTQRCP